MIAQNIKLRLLSNLAINYWRGSGDQKTGYMERVGATLDYLRCRNILHGLNEIYQPIPIPGFEDLNPVRPCSDRLALISEDMGHSFHEVTDIGCQIGYFSFSLAQKGFSVRGYDSNPTNIRFATTANKLLGDSKPIFKCLEFNLETAPMLESADYTLCLAVFHHIIYHHGLSTANILLACLRKKTRQKLYFEIGQKNEPIEPWVKHLPDMGDDPLHWIVNFLNNGGFRDVKVLGLVPTHLSNVPRYLVAAS